MDFNNEKMQENEGMLDAMQADYESFKQQNATFTPCDRTLSVERVAHYLWRKWLRS